MKIIDRSDFTTLIDELIASDPRDVVGVQEAGEQYVFDRLESAGDLTLEYDLTALSPKKYVMPQRETLLTYDRTNDDYEMRAEADPTGHIVVGV
ncbi:MAG: Ni/Fe hydrogenase subunit beta, partial [Halorhabdus sp.]